MPSGIVKLNKEDIMKYFVMKVTTYQTLPAYHSFEHNQGFDKHDTAQRFAELKQEMEIDKNVTYTVIALSD